MNQSSKFGMALASKLLPFAVSLSLLPVRCFETSAYSASASLGCFAGKHASSSSICTSCARFQGFRSPGSILTTAPSANIFRDHPSNRFHLLFDRTAGVRPLPWSSTGAESHPVASRHITNAYPMRPRRNCVMLMNGLRGGSDPALSSILPPSIPKVHGPLHRNQPATAGRHWPSRIEFFPTKCRGVVGQPLKGIAFSCSCFYLTTVTRTSCHLCFAKV
jgi:hypothetical protein